MSKREKRERQLAFAIRRAELEDAEYREKCSHLPPALHHAWGVRWPERFPPGVSFWKCYYESEPVAWETLYEATRSNGLVLRLSSACEYRHHANTGATFVIAKGFTGERIVKTVVCLRLDRLLKR
jgi:hypothetical protein